MNNKKRMAQIAALILLLSIFVFLMVTQKDLVALWFLFLLMSWSAALKVINKRFDDK
ncbi:hypothetical protein [Weissella confusa]|uniref:hypothetical protein n=1 Tax=Weissella confusa TaxID=1583 RepID=UPI000B3253CA|nr:hypothetical protein [Weissella confusa]